jgi:hypothetical protein
VTNAHDQTLVPTRVTNMPAYVTSTSILNGKTRTMKLKLYEQDEFDVLMHAYKEGKIATLEEAFPLLSPKAIDFIRHGILPGEWDANE